jgi:hypothetical protein
MNHRSIPIDRTAAQSCTLLVADAARDESIPTITPTSRRRSAARSARTPIETRLVACLSPHFSGIEFRCNEATLQLSSYVRGRPVLHMTTRRFAQVFVASKALNHLQLSLTIARIC